MGPDRFDIGDEMLCRVGVELGERRRATAAALIERHHPEAVGCEAQPLARLGATARSAMQHDHGQSIGGAADLSEEPVAVTDVELEGLKIRRATCHESARRAATNRRWWERSAPRSRACTSPSVRAGLGGRPMLRRVNSMTLRNRLAPAGGLPTSGRIDAAAEAIRNARDRGAHTLCGSDRARRHSRRVFELRGRPRGAAFGHSRAPRSRPATLSNSGRAWSASGAARWWWRSRCAPSPRPRRAIAARAHFA